MWISQGESRERTTASEAGLQLVKQCERLSNTLPAIRAHYQGKLLWLSLTGSAVDIELSAGQLLVARQPSIVLVVHPPNLVKLQFRGESFLVLSRIDAYSPILTFSDELG